MALFSDSARFTKTTSPMKANSQIHGFASPSTADHVGPAGYFAPEQDEKRNGWATRSFSRGRQPMDVKDRVSKTEPSRSDSYVRGALAKNGVMMAQPNADKCNSPGPGQYERSVFPVQSPVSK